MLAETGIVPRAGRRAHRAAASPQLIAQERATAARAAPPTISTTSRG